VTTPTFGARNLKQRHDNLGAAALQLRQEATATLDRVNAPVAAGYPYETFGKWQRGRRS
jgi:aryl-alcohol dehydrogenase-like predicted oxidoreductase